MPNLRIETNVPKGNIKDLPAFLKELSSALAATTGKPEQYMVVQVTSQFETQATYLKPTLWQFEVLL